MWTSSTTTGWTRKLRWRRPWERWPRRVRSGKALYAGLSNYNGPTLEKAAALLDEMGCPFVINQNRYSIFDRTVEQNGLLENRPAVCKRA